MCDGPVQSVVVKDDPRKRPARSTAKPAPPKVGTKPRKTGEGEPSAAVVPAQGAEERAGASGQLD